MNIKINILFVFSLILIILPILGLPRYINSYIIFTIAIIIFLIAKSIRKEFKSLIFKIKKTENIQNSSI